MAFVVPKQQQRRELIFQMGEDGIKKGHFRGGRFPSTRRGDSSSRRNSSGRVGRHLVAGINFSELRVMGIVCVREGEQGEGRKRGGKGLSFSPRSDLAVVHNHRVCPLHQLPVGGGCMGNGD